MSGFEGDCERVETYMTRHYGIPVVIRDIPDPLTGDLDGTEIHIDYALNYEQRLFLVLHLFGHTVQWNTNERAREIGRPQTPPVDEALLPAIEEYERQAGEYALWLLKRAGVRGRDRWLADYTAADIAFLMHYYRTGQKLEFASVYRAGARLLNPRPVPSFRPRKWVSRLDGIVL